MSIWTFWRSISASTAYCNNATIQQIIIIIRGHQSRGLNWGWLRISFHSTVVLDYLKIIEYFQQLSLRSDYGRNRYSASISEAKFVLHPTNPHLVDSLWDPFGSWPFSERWSKQKFCRGLVKAVSKASYWRTVVIVGYPRLWGQNVVRNLYFVLDGNLPKKCVI